MGRRPRTNVPGGLYHVMARGNSRQAIFFDDDDYLVFLDLLSEAMRRHGHRLHAYCLMTNHVHLLVQMRDVSVSVLAQRVMSRYSRWQNRRLGRSGHLFERRHRSFLVRTDEQLRHLLRYIHRNPLRAGMVTDCASYRWSSHRAFLGEGSEIEVATTPCLAALDEDPRRAVGRYRALIETEDPQHDADIGVESDPRDEPGTWRGLGLDALEAEVRRRLPPPSCPRRESELDALIAVAAMSGGCTPGELQGPSRARRVTRARAAAAWIAIEHARLDLSALARSLGRDPSTLSEAASRFGRRLGDDDACRQLLAAVRSGLGG